MTTTRKRKPMCSACKKPTWVCKCGGERVASVKPSRRVRADEGCHKCGSEPCACSDFVCSECRRTIGDCVCENGFDDPVSFDQETDRLISDMLGDDGPNDLLDGHDTELYRSMAPAPSSSPRRVAKKGVPTAPNPMPMNQSSGSNFLNTLALAHQKHEGWHTGSVSQRYNNPGNLVYIGQAGATRGSVHGFAVFPSYAAGFQALKNDLQAKLTGHSRHVNPNGTFQDYVNVYAPNSDGNDPTSYASSLIADLQSAGYPVQMSTPLTEVAKLI